MSLDCYKIGIVLATAMLLFVGCQPDLLETTPDDRVSGAIFWKTVDDARAAANAVYPTLDGVNIIEYDGITDLVQTNRPFSANIEVQRGIADASHDRYLSEWRSAYRAIRRANEFLDNVESVEGDQEEINRLKGEVMVLRAYHYTKLAILFGDVPLLTTGISIEEGRNVVRTPVEQVWDFIKEDLTQAAAWLPLDNGERIARGAANGLKARAMLFAGRYQEAAAAAAAVIESGVYSLYPSYYGLFQYEGENSGEVILDREFLGGVDGHNVYTVLAPWSQISGSAGSQYVPTAAMVDLYDMENGLSIDDPASGFDPRDPYKDRDPRLYASVFLDGVTEMPDGTIYGSAPNGGGTDYVGRTVYTTSTGFNVRKYVSPDDLSDPANSGLNIILMRYAEVLLTYAEAKIELGQIDASVYGAINAVRQRESVDMPPITPADASTQEELRAIVRKERTIELAFEGFRLFDIRRWGIAEDVMPGTPMGMRYVDDGGAVEQVVLTGFDRLFNPSRDYLWPIPSRERELTTGLTQNNEW